MPTDHKTPSPVAEHKRRAYKLNFFAITVSDTRTPENDGSGTLIIDLMQQADHNCLEKLIVPDNIEDIKTAFHKCVDDSPDIILLSGGTGIAKRDNTVRALSPLLDQQINGFGELFRMLSYDEIGSAAMLSRAAAGIANGVLVFMMPGSSNAVRLAMEKLIIPELNHMKAQLQL